MTTESDRWQFFETDARLVQEEAENQIAEQKQFLTVEEALTEWDAYIQGLSIEDAQAALEGLKEYAEAVLKEREIEQGWHRTVED